jgi:uncharacterized protein (TIGR03382 family)
MTKLHHTGLFAALVAMGGSLSARAAVPSAVCARTTDRPESGVSGETNAADRLKAGAGFKCNADLVGQYQGDGASWQLTAWKTCAYFDQRNVATAGAELEKNPGSVVVDVSDPTHPTPTTWLQEKAMIDPWESIKVNPARQLLAGGQRPLGGSTTAEGDFFNIYDISQDCKHPKLLNTALPNQQIPGSLGHTGQFTPDGLTYWITPLQNTISMLAIDVTDPSTPVEIPGSLVTFQSRVGTTVGTGTSGAPTLALPRIHDLEFTADGKTAYITEFGNGGTAAGNGMAILDVSDFQTRKTNPQYRVLGEITWDDGSVGAQNALPITIAGKPYILNSDEGGGGAAGCAAGKSANGFPRLIDISDNTKPTVVAKIQLGVADPVNCASVSTAPITATANAAGAITTAPGFFAHSCHYCNVDDPSDAKILACSCFAAGFRVFDIHDPASIKEMAYYKPPAMGTKAMPASQLQTPAGFVKTYDYTTAKVSFPKDRGASSGDIWITSQENGFQVIHLFSALAVSPKAPAVFTGGTQAFSAAVTGAAGTAGALWSVQEGAAGGSIDAKGNYTAPTTPGTYHIVATALLDGKAIDTTTVSVITPVTGGGCSSTGASMGALLALAALVFAMRSRRSHA